MLPSFSSVTIIKNPYFRMLRRKVSYVFLAAIPSTVEKAREALKKSGRKI